MVGNIVVVVVGVDNTVVVVGNIVVVVVAESIISGVFWGQPAGVYNTAVVADSLVFGVSVVVVGADSIAVVVVWEQFEDADSQVGYRWGIW